MTGSTATTFQPGSEDGSRAVRPAVASGQFSGAHRKDWRSPTSPTAHGGRQGRGVGRGANGHHKGELRIPPSCLPRPCPARDGDLSVIQQLPGSYRRATYTDAAQISAWAVDAVNYCTAQKLMTGTTRHRLRRRRKCGPRHRRGGYHHVHPGRQPQAGKSLKPQT